MSSQIPNMESLDMTVSNLGGIDHREAEISPGITVLSGPNATNRTSFLRALATAFGVDKASLQTSKDEGYVSIDIDGAEYTRQFQRTDTGVSRSGEPFTEGSSAKRELAFLLKSHPIRQLIRGDFSATELRDELMAPVDTDTIQQNIADLKDEKEEIRDALEDIAEIETRHSDNKIRLEELKNELDDLETKRDDLTTQVEEAEEQTPDISETITDLQDTLDTKRSKKTELEREIELSERKITNAQETLEDLSGEATDTSELQRQIEILDAEKTQYAEQKRNLSSELQDIKQLKSTVVSIIEDEKSISDIASNYPLDTEIFEDGPLRSAVSQDKPLTDSLVDSTDTTCPVCGTTVGTDQLEQVRTQLSTIVESITTQKENLRDDWNEVKGEINHLKQQKDDIENNAETIEDCHQTIEDSQSDKEQAQADLEKVKADIAEAEAALEDAQEEKNETYIQAREELREVETTIEATKSSIERLEEDIASDAEKLNNKANLEAQREEVSADLTAEREKVSTLESDLADTITEELATVVDILDYENIEMVTVNPKYSGPDQDRDTEFELVISRSADGTTYRDDSLDHFSGSERAVLGLVVALAAYLVHNVGELVPVIALDAIEMIDATRINKLLQHFGDRVDYLVVALLQEDADAVDAHTEIAF